MCGFKKRLTITLWSLASALNTGSVLGDSAITPVDPHAMPEPTPSETLDVEELWQQATPISDDVLEIWTEAIDNLGSTENRSCKYTKITAPCDDCGEELIRRSFFALRHSLLQPGFKALMEWFDTPATHTVSARVEEQFDATLEPPWTLLTLDNVEPTEAQRYSHFQEKIAQYSSVEQKRARKEERIPVGDFHPASMQSWFKPLVPTHYLGTKEGKIVIGLKPHRKTKSPLNQHIQLTMEIDTTTNELASFDQRAIRSFVPHFGLRVREFNYRGTLERDPILDVVVLKHFEYSFQVRLTAVFSSKNRFRHWYQDFECVEDLGDPQLSEQK